MKNVLLLTVLMLAFSNVFAQEKEKEISKSNAEIFSGRDGSLMKKEFVDVGSLKKCNIQVVHYTDLISHEKRSAVRFEYEYVSSYSTDTKISVLDSDEIDALIKSILLMQNDIMVTTPANYTEAAYKSRGGFECGCYSNSGKGTWSSFLKLEKYDSKSFVPLSADDLNTLIQLLEKAKALL